MVTPVDPTSSTRLLLVRHAESTWNAGRRWQGQADPPLSATGRRQAEELAEAVSAIGVTVLVSSDLRRALDTVGPLARGLQLPVFVDPAWRERDIGAWAGHTREEVRARWPEEYARFRSRDPAVRPGGGESTEEFRRRVLGVACRTVGQYSGETVLVLTHRGVIRLLAPDRRPEHATPLAIPVDTLGRPADGRPGPEPL